MGVDSTTLVHGAGLRVTKQRVAVVSALAANPHASAGTILKLVRANASAMSTQAVYDVLHTLTDRGIVRRIQPAGSVARYELRVGDNHHHMVCRDCGDVTDIDCVVGAAPCLSPGDARQLSEFVVDEAEVTFWGRCGSCSSVTTDQQQSEE